MDFLETSPISPEAFTTPSAGTTSSSLYLPLPVSPFIGITKEIPPEELIGDEKYEGGYYFGCIKFDGRE